MVYLAGTCRLARAFLFYFIYLIQEYSTNIQFEHKNLISKKQFPIPDGQHCLGSADKWQIFEQAEVDELRN